MNKGINYLWPTRVLYDTVNDNQLLDLTVQEIFETIDLKNPPSDFGGPDGLFENCGPSLTKFKDLVVKPAFDKYLKEVYNTRLEEYKKYRVKSWITGTGNGYNMVYHNHAGAAVSAVFYLLAEDSQAGGNIIFSDPRINANRGYEKPMSSEFDNVTHIPASGDILIFPSFLYHYVNPYYSSLRIAMPVDLFLYHD